jgi:hypothetical protein
MNETMVREALQLVADGAGDYPVLKPALRRARRARAARLIAVPVALGLVVAGVLSLAPTLASLQVAGGGSTPSTGGVRLPDRLDAPGVVNSTIADKPPGSVPVVMAGSRFPVSGLFYTNRAVTLSPAGYRWMDWRNAWPVMPGENLLLAPDGTKVAWLEDGVKVQDLDTGQIRTVARGPFVDGRRQLMGWSPDGTFLAYAERQPPGRVPEGTPPTVEIGLLDVVTGGVRRVIEARDTGPGELPGLAFSPDGLRVAYQSGDYVEVAGLGQPATWRLELPRGAVLAGKAAWTRDGTAVAVAVPQEWRDAAVTSWRLLFLDAQTGRARRELAFPDVPGASLIRLVGWTPAGEAVAVAYVGRPDPGPVDTYASRTDFHLVRRVDLVALGPGAGEPRVLLSAPDGIEALDVAEQAVATEGVAAVPRTPFVLNPRWWWALAVGGLLLAQIVIAFVAVAVMRSRRPGSSAVQIAGTADRTVGRHP